MLGRIEGMNGTSDFTALTAVTAYFNPPV